MRRRFLALIVTSAFGAFLVLTPAPMASGKEGVKARLETPVPLDAWPGQRITLAWTLSYVESGEHHPFNAIGIFVRLRSASGEEATVGFAHAGAHPRGRYQAVVSVPEGGIGGIQIGIKGTTEERFPIVNNPFRGSGPLAAIPAERPEAGRDVQSLPAVVLGVILAGLAVGAVAAALKRRRMQAEYVHRSL